MNCFTNVKSLSLYLLIFLPTVVWSQISLEFGINSVIYNRTSNNDLNSFNKIDDVQPTYICFLINQAYVAGGANDSETWRATVSYAQMIPYQTTIQDSLSMKLSGFCFRQVHELFLWQPSKSFSILTSIGASMGRLKLWGDKSANQKNQFFRPEVGIQPRLLIGRIAFSLNAFYGLDIGSGKWKKSWFNKTSQVDLPRFTQGGLDLGFSLGYAF